jgi:hypothetical protein
VYHKLGCPSGLRGQTQVRLDIRSSVFTERLVCILVVTDCVGSNPTLSTIPFCRVWLNLAQNQIFIKILIVY